MFERMKKNPRQQKILTMPLEFLALLLAALSSQSTRLKCPILRSVLEAVGMVTGCLS